MALLVDPSAYYQQKILDLLPAGTSIPGMLRKRPAETVLEGSSKSWRAHGTYDDDIAEEVEALEAFAAARTPSPPTTSLALDTSADRTLDSGAESAGAKSVSLEAGYATSIGKRAAMEDRVVVKRLARSGGPVYYFAVFDGHGGSQAASFAATSLHTKLADSVHFASQDLGEGLCEAFRKTDTEFIETVNSDSGTCGTVVCISESSMWTANAGDCRAVLCSQRAGEDLQANRLSEDHKPSRADEKARIEAAGGQVVHFGCWRVTAPDNSIMLATSRALGDRHFKRREPHIVTAEPDISKHELQPSEDSFVIIACDGLFDVMSDVEACQIAAIALAGSEADKVESPRNPKDDVIECGQFASGEVSPRAEFSSATIAAHALVVEALERGSQDNISVIVVRLP